MSLSPATPIPIIPMIDSATGNPVGNFNAAVNTNVSAVITRHNSAELDILELNVRTLPAAAAGAIGAPINGSTLPSIMALFTNELASTINFPSVTSGSITYPGFTVDLPAGAYIDTDAIPLINIEKVVDSDEFVKMRIEERNYISDLRGLIDSNNIFKLQVNTNAPLQETVKFTSGSTLNISQIGSTETSPTEIRFESSVPLEYYRLSRYNVIPTKPDAANPYRYKVNTGPYVNGTLRVYINSHRIEASKLDQGLSGIGEFRFISTIPFSELPSSRQEDVITCDFDIPLFSGPEDEESDSQGNWWGDIVTQTDSGLLEADQPMKTLRYYPLIGNYGASSGFEIRNSNPYGSTDTGIDTVYFIIDVGKIDHNLLLNYESDRHHASGSDNQLLWSRIVDPLSNSITPATQAANLSLTSADSSIAISVAGASIDFSIGTPTVIHFDPLAAAPSGPTEGDVYVNSVSHNIYCYLNGGWVQLNN